MISGSTTEQSSYYDNLEDMSVNDLLVNMNNEDKKVAVAVEQSIPQIEPLVLEIVKRFKKGGRLFYIGAGTSGRLGVLDASECPPTYGVPDQWVIGLIAGGDGALRKAVENAEDDPNQGWKDLIKYNISTNDFVIGIAASGTTPYVLGAIDNCNKNKIPTGCITCNPGSPISKISNYPIEVGVGPEVITGSSRMKAGTAQKLILNMISTTVMIKMGRVKGNKMVDMQLSNKKLVNRATLMLMTQLNITEKKAKLLLSEYKSVRNAIKNFKK